MQLTTRFRLILVLICLYGFSNDTLAQNPAAIKRLGDDFFRAGKYQEAVLQYSQYQLDKPGDLDVLTRLGISYYELRDLAKSVEYFEYVLSSGARKANAEAFYYLAKSYQLQEKWNEAIKYFKLYLGVAPSKHMFRRSAVDEIQRCAFAREFKPDNLVSIVQNLGPEINTSFNEQSPVQSVLRTNRLFFSSARQESAGGLRRADGIADEVEGKYTSDIFYADKSQNGTYVVSQLPELINTARHEQILDFTPDGKVMFYLRGFEQYSGDILTDTAGVKDEHGQEHVFAGPLSGMHGDQDLCIVHDSLCVFASRRAGGMGGLDIYYAQKMEGVWQEAINMGPDVNSPYDDRYPFLSIDGNMLYFSSNRIQSLGGLDVFFVEFDALKKTWSEARNLGSPVNSAADETGFRIAPSGKVAYFASNRQGGQGGFDLYQAFFRKTTTEAITRLHPKFLDLKSLEATASKQTRQFAQLMHTTDQDVLSSKNYKILKEIAAITKANQQGALIVTAHVEENASPLLDAFVGIQRAHIVRAELIKLGVPESRITTRSYGSTFPAAQNVLGDTENELAKKYNNRVMVELINLSTQTYYAENEIVAVPEIMKAEGQAAYAELNQNISYRVFFLKTNQMYSDDVLGMFPTISIEHQSTAGVTQYMYYSGLFKDVMEAVTIREDLKNQGFEHARIVPFLFGKEITRQEAIVLRDKYPELSKYLGLK